MTLMNQSPSALQINTSILSRGDIPLYMAAAKANPGIIKILLDRCALLNSSNSASNTPLHEALMLEYPAQQDKNSST